MDGDLGVGAGGVEGVGVAGAEGLGGGFGELEGAPEFEAVVDGFDEEDGGEDDDGKRGQA